MKMMLQALIVMTAFLSGCAGMTPMQALKDTMGISMSPEDLAMLPASTVCMQMGVAEYRSNPQAYLNAKSEANTRIYRGEVTVDDCITFSRMGFNEKIQSSNELNNRMNSLDRQMEQAQPRISNCVQTQTGVRCTTM